MNGVWGISYEIALSHWFRYWLGAVRQQAITLANVDPDLCRQIVSLGLNELTLLVQSCIYIYFFSVRPYLFHSCFLNFIPANAFCANKLVANWLHSSSRPSAYWRPNEDKSSAPGRSPGNERFPFWGLSRETESLEGTSAKNGDCLDINPLCNGVSWTNMKYIWTVDHLSAIKLSRYLRSVPWNWAFGEDLIED